MYILKHTHMLIYSAWWSISVPWGCRQAPAAVVSGCRSVRHNVEELPGGSTWKGRTMEPQCRRSSRGHGKPICQPGRAALSSPASDLLLAHTMEGGRSRARGNGGEFPAFYNKMESSILVTIGIGHRLHPEFVTTFNDYSEVISVAQCCSWRQFMGQWSLLITFVQNCLACLCDSWTCNTRLILHCRHGYHNKLLDNLVINDIFKESTIFFSIGHFLYVLECCKGCREAHLNRQ